MNEIQDEDKILSSTLKEMKEGETKAYRLPTKAAIYAARSMATYMSNMSDEYRYRTSASFETRIISITKEKKS